MNDILVKEAIALENEGWDISEDDQILHHNFVSIYTNKLKGFVNYTNGISDKEYNISLAEYAISASKEDLEEIIKEVIENLKEAKRKISFSHGNLHVKNIILDESGPLIDDFRYSSLYDNYTTYGSPISIESDIRILVDSINQYHPGDWSFDI